MIKEIFEFIWELFNKPQSAQDMMNAKKLSYYDPDKLQPTLVPEILPVAVAVPLEKICCPTK